MIKVAIIGVGTVGSSVANILKNNAKIIEARSGKKIVPIIGVVKDITKKRDVDIELTDDINSVIERDDIDIYVELMGGVEKAYEVVKKILKKGKTIVTANKALLAYHRYDLQKEAKILNTSIGIEASVAGGIPVIKALREGLSANQILAVRGIINGTCNFILTKMMNERANFKETLEEAQRLGYAEADPTFDVGGFDTAHKLLILASIAYGIEAKPEEILIEGIENITPEDIYFAKDFEYNIKLLGIAKKVGKKVEIRVHPALVPQERMLARIDGVMNGVSIIGDSVGETMYYGAGAGGDATASAVIADIIDIVREDKSSPMLGYMYSPDKEKLSLMSQTDIQTKYYVRVKVKDEIGVLARISKLLEECQISVDSFLQKPDIKQSSNTTLFFATHTCKESDIQKALKKISSLEFVLDKPMIIRIEDWDIFDSNVFGKDSEQKAVKFLKKSGLKIIEQNFHSRFGEIDIVAEKDDILHFVEVKATSKDYDALDRITPQKLEKIIKTIDFFLLKNATNQDYQIDAIIINNKKIEWIKNIYY